MHKASRPSATNARMMLMILSDFSISLQRYSFFFRQKNKRNKNYMSACSYV